MDTGRNKTFKLSGSSVLPLYPGFIVINIPKLGKKCSTFFSPRKTSVVFPLSKAFLIERTCYAMTDKTSILIRLNSSRQVQEPVIASPKNRLSIILKLIWSLQLNTTQYFPRALERSFVLSVFPVPAGPDGAAPNFKCKAPVIVSQHLSVKGVITILVVAPWYS